MLNLRNTFGAAFLSLGLVGCATSGGQPERAPRPTSADPCVDRFLDTQDQFSHADENERAEFSEADLDPRLSILECQAVSNYLSIERLAIIKILAVYDPAETLSPKEMSALNDFLNALVVEGPVREDIKRYYDLTAKLSRIEGEFVPTFEELVETITRIKERQESDFNSVPELGF